MSMLLLAGRVLLSLGATIGAILLLARFYQRRGIASRTKGSVSRRSNAISIVSRASLSKGSQLAVVEVEGRRLLIGVSPNSISLLDHLDAEDEVVKAIPKANEKVIDLTSVAKNLQEDSLADLTAMIRSNETEAERKGIVASFEEVLNQKLSTSMLATLAKKGSVAR
ncbi:MAG: flagellar biosynthetic protein FliO [Actinomycetota bacterium]|nr:flagellar biosynthetic protein FliO [Actinomycetota bacterium]